MPRKAAPKEGDAALEPRRSTRIKDQPKPEPEPVKEKKVTKPRSKKADAQNGDEKPKSGRGKKRTAEEAGADDAADGEPAAKKAKPASKAASKPPSKAASKPASKAASKPPSKAAAGSKPASRAASAKPASRAGSKKPASRAGSKKPASKVGGAVAAEANGDTSIAQETIAEEPEPEADATEA